jgi:signal transduction histidine kinase
MRAVRLLVEAAGRSGTDVALLERLCGIVTESLGFDRAVAWRYVGVGDRIDLVNAYGVSLQELAELTHASAIVPALEQARDRAAAVLLRGESTTAIIPLIGLRGCLGHVIADSSADPFDLDVEAEEALTTLGLAGGAFLEAAVAREEALRVDRMKTGFIALAAHELRAPATAICGAAATLHLRSDLSDGQRKDLARLLHDQGEHLRLLVSQLLDLSRLEERSIRIEPEPLAVRVRTEEIVRTLAAERAPEIELAIDPELRADADPDAFDRIVSNLIANALEHGEQPITVSATQLDCHFRLSVEDRGLGVPAAFVPHLFERFTRGDAERERRGAGLGLSIAQAYANAHGGELLYEDALPRGSCFRLVVPQMQPPRFRPNGGRQE